MAGFTLRSNPDDGNVVLAGINSTAVAVGDVLWLATGSTYYMAYSSDIEDWQVKAVAIEVATTSSSYVKAIRVTPDQLWEVESTNNSNANHNGDRMILTDGNTVNNTGTNSTASGAVVYQEGTIGAVGDKRILVRFIGADGQDPSITS